MVKIFRALTVLFLILAANSFAQDDQKQERRAKPILSNSVYRPINQAQEAMQEGDYAKALAVLDDLLARGDRLKAYDRAKTLQMMTIVYIQQQDYPKAVASSIKALAVDALEIEAQTEMRYNLVSMLFVLERYDEALQQLEIWIEENPELNAQENFTAAQLYLTADRITEAQQYAEAGMALHQADESSAPKENWYRLLLSIYGRQKDYSRAAHWAEQLLSLWPAKVEYYHQLSGLYQQLERQKEAWAILDIAFHNQLLTKQDDYIRLLQLHRFFGYPYRGAEIFQQAMHAETVETTEDHWEDLANAWLQSRQWQQAETALKQAAQISSSGQHWVRLCRTALQDERWQDSHGYCQNALDKGGLGDDKASTWQLMATVNFSMNNYSDAIQYFQRCSKEQSTQQYCQEWLSHVENVLARAEQQRKRAEEQAKLAEQRRQNRDSMINQALLMIE